MKPPLQALLIAPSRVMRRDILNGVKTITVREGHRDYKPGLVMICCHFVPWCVMAEITNIRHCILQEITEEEWEADGFHSQEDLLEGMKKFYPNMALDSPVTVIRWKNVQGFLVENKLEYQYKPQTLYAKIPVLES